MSDLTYTPLDEIEKIHAGLETTFKSGKLQDIAYRKYVLAQLAYLIKDNQDALSAALEKDLGKPPIESEYAELSPTIAEAVSAFNSVSKWAKPESPSFSPIWSPTRRVIYKEGKGVVLVIAAFNFPFTTGYNPVISAIAAGNTVLFKPSEMTPSVAALFAELFPKYVDPSVIRVVNGSIPETAKMLELPYGHIMFTGSGRVGKIVAGAAAKTLTPVTLELGGKSPVIVDPKTCNVQNAAKRIVWGKTHNSGQVCIAPDYAIVPRAHQDVFVDALQKAIQEFFPDGPFAPRAMGKMVNTAAFKRVRTLIEESKGEVVSGGEYDESTKGIAPTIVKNCTWDDALMSQELFGPVLPIIPVDSIDEGLAHIRSNDSPLALYAFTFDSKLQDKIRRETQSGSILFNDVVVQAAAEGLPFGGVGPSGSGGYHNGKFGFDVFTHNRASMNNHPILDLFMSFRYPPFVARTFVMKMMAPPMPTRPKGPPTSTVSARQAWSKWIVLLVALVFAGGLTSHRLKGPAA